MPAWQAMHELERTGMNGLSWQLLQLVPKALCALDPERDVQFSLGPVDTLDHAQRLQDYGSKMGIDATRKWETEGFTRPWPDEIKMDEATRARMLSALSSEVRLLRR